jgi:hypothetical protein
VRLERDETVLKELLDRGFIVSNVKVIGSDDLLNSNFFDPFIKFFITRALPNLIFILIKLIGLQYLIANLAPFEGKFQSLMYRRDPTAL